MTVPLRALNTAFNKYYVQIAKTTANHCGFPTGLVKRNGQHHECSNRDLFLNLYALVHFLSPRTDKKKITMNNINAEKFL